MGKSNKSVCDWRVIRTLFYVASCGLAVSTIVIALLESVGQHTLTWGGAAVYFGVAFCVYVVMLAVFAQYHTMIAVKNTNSILTLLQHSDIIYAMIGVLVYTILGTYPLIKYFRENDFEVDSVATRPSYAASFTTAADAVVEARFKDFWILAIVLSLIMIIVRMVAYRIPSGVKSGSNTACKHNPSAVSLRKNDKRPVARSADRESA